MNKSWRKGESMINFSISSYISTLKNKLIFDNTDLACATLLFNSIELDSSVNIDNKMISNLINRKTEVHSKIKQAFSEPSTDSDCLKYFEKVIIPEIHPYLINETISEIMKLIKSDDSISEKDMQQFKTLYEENNIISFLSKSFLLALVRTNKQTDKQVLVDDASFILEVNGTCPLCGDRLVKIIKGKSIKKYELIKIYPEKISNQVFGEIKKIDKRPSNLNSDGNMICVCRDCADDYTATFEIENYIRLKNLKYNIIKKYNFQLVQHTQTLEDEIITIIEKLKNESFGINSNGYQIDVMPIEKKILPQNKILKRDLTDDVLKYFNFVQSNFTGIDKFNIIKSEINTMFRKIEIQYSDQNEIKEILIDWILFKTGLPISHRRACAIIVSFFVQICEVFYEVTK